MLNKKTNLLGLRFYLVKYIFNYNQKINCLYVEKAKNNTY